MAISYEEARKCLQEIAKLRKRKTRTVETGKACGLILAEDVYASHAVPRFDNSAMDGILVASQDTRSASPETPCTFAVAGTLAAGDLPLSHTQIKEAYQRIKHRPICWRFMTGAAFPHESASNGYAAFDACIRIEKVTKVSFSEEELELLQIIEPVGCGKERRRAGEDIQAEEQLLPKDTVLTSQQLMVLLSAGVSHCLVYTPWKIGVIATGKELVSDLKDDFNSSKILNSNGPYLAATLRQWGYEAEEIQGGHPDSISEFQTLLQDHATNKHDLIITSGAVSKGVYDFLPSYFKQNGTVHFHGIKMRPGSPALFATSSITKDGQETDFIGLPGNPVAAAICLRFLVRPYLESFSSKQDDPVYARITTPIKVPTSTSNYRVIHLGIVSYAKDGTVNVEVLEKRASSLKQMLEANAWVEVSENWEVEQVAKVWRFEV